MSRPHLACRYREDRLGFPGLRVRLQRPQDQCPGVGGSGQLSLGELGRPAAVLEQHPAVLLPAQLPGHRRPLPVPCHRELGQAGPRDPAARVQLVDPHLQLRAAEAEAGDRADAGLGRAVGRPERRQPGGRRNRVEDRLCGSADADGEHDRSGHSRFLLYCRLDLIPWMAQVARAAVTGSWGCAAASSRRLPPTASALTTPSREKPAARVSAGRNPAVKLAGAPSRPLAANTAEATATPKAPPKRCRLALAPDALPRSAGATALSAAIIRKAVVLAAVKLRLRNSRSGSIGAGARRSQATNPAMSPMPRVKVAMISGLPQPTWLARTSAHRMPAAPPETSPTAGRSRRVAGP